MSDPKSDTTAYQPGVRDLCICRSCGDLAPDAIKEIDRLQAAINEAYRIMCSGTPPHSARETNARRVLRLAGVTVKEQSA